MKIRNFIIAAIIAGLAYIPSAMTYGAERQWGSVECWQFLKTPKILGSGGTLLFPDILRLNADGTGINTSGSLGFGAASTDSGIYWDGTNLVLDTTGAIDFSISGTTEADLAADGFNIITGDSYQINNTSVLDATTLGSGVLASSLTSLGTIASLVATTANITGDTTIGGALKYGTDTLTTSSDDPGTGTATLAEIITYVISDATGVETDVVTLIDGTLEGQIKRIILLTDGETEGTVVAPTNVTMVGGAGTSTKMEDAGDFVEFTWNSTLGWTLTGNIGATIQ